MVFPHIHRDFNFNSKFFVFKGKLLQAAGRNELVAAHDVGYYLVEKQPIQV